MFTTNPENERIVSLLVRELSDLPVGGTVAYAKLSAVSGRDLANGSRYLLARARDGAEKTLGCIFEAVKGVGIRRLTPDEAPDVGLSAIRGCRRKARRGSTRIKRINSNSLSRTELQRARSYSDLLGAIAMMADGNKARTIAAVVDPVKPIPPEDILRMFVK